MLLTCLGESDEIPAFAGMTCKVGIGKKKRRGMQWIPAFARMTFAAPLFQFNPEVPSFQRKLESA